MLKNGLLLVMITLVCLIAACEKSEVYDENAQYLLDETLINKWADSTKVRLTKDPSGLYYSVLTPGTGTSVAGNSDVLSVFYSLRLLGKDSIISNVIDTPGYKFVLGASIPGWKNGLPLIKEGGRIRLIVPSGQAYRNYEVVQGIPKNSVLDFTVDLIEIKKEK